MNIKQQIFAKYYSKTTSKIISSYYAGYCDNIKDKVKFTDLSHKQLVNLKKSAGILLSKHEVIEEIRKISNEEAEKLGEAGLNEILSYLSLLMRRSREDLKNYKLMRNALKACELLLRRYPEFKGNISEEINFSRGTEEELN